MYRGKRLFDIIFSIIGVLMFFPVWLVSSCLIFCLDGRPILFTQTRVGLQQRGFTIYKFRTMTEKGEVTRTGRWLRATGIDESVQFISVLKGDMSIVGPRPFLDFEIIDRRLQFPWHAWRWSVKPGITGLAQVNEQRATRRSVAWDRIYVRKSGVGTDVLLVVQTYAMNVFGKERVRRLMERMACKVM